MIQGYFTYSTDILKVTGKDKGDFFNRIGTNRFTDFPFLKFVNTVFLNEKGRIFDFCSVLNCKETFFLICTPGNGDKLNKHIEKYIVTEDINVIKEHAVISYFIDNDYLFVDFELESNTIAVLEENLIFKDNYGFQKTVILESGNPNNVFLRKIKDKTDRIGDTDFHIFGVENFFLHSSNEICDSFNPLGCYLKEFITFDKGCYIGQEVIARMDSQNKIPEYLVKIESDAEIRKGDKIYSKYEFQELECGLVTSVYEKSGHYFGFGFIKSNFIKNSGNFQINREVVSIKYNIK